MTVSFDASDLSAYTTKVAQQADSVIKRGQALPAAIAAQTAAIVPTDPQVVAAAAEAKSSLNSQAVTLGKMFEGLGARVGTVGTDVKTFMDRSIAETGHGVSKLGDDSYQVTTPEALSSATGGLGSIDGAASGKGGDTPTPTASTPAAPAPANDGPPTLADGPPTLDDGPAPS